MKYHPHPPPIYIWFKVQVAFLLDFYHVVAELLGNNNWTLITTRIQYQQFAVSIYM